MESVPGIINPCPTTLPGPASHLFLTLINTLIVAQCPLSPEGRYPPDYGPALKDGDEFDFIVVGAGSAGAVVANRLSEEEGWKVLLLEAGGYPSALTEIPALLFSVQGTSEDWQYTMELSETCCLGLRGGVCPCPRGKGLGGSSLLNAMIYARGNRRDFDSWAEAGNTEWDYDSVQRSYANFENFEGDTNGSLKKGGELGLSRYVDDQPVHEILKKAYRELGYQEYTEDNPLGYTDALLTVYQGTRSNTGKAFIEKVKERQNLFVAVNAYVSKLLVDEVSVNGVEVRINGNLLRLKARKEVILSAGSISSPRILMHSGIGPQEHLESVGIECLRNLQVGRNLQDHLLYPMFVNVGKSVLRPKTPLDQLDELYQYFMHRRGPLSQIEITNFLGFLNTKPDSAFPDLQVLHTVHYPNDAYLLPEVEKAFRVPEEAIEVYNRYNKEANSMIVGPILLKPKSAGRILLRSADPFDKPLIHPNYLSDDEDLETVLKGVKIMEKLLATQAFEEYQPELVDPQLPNCKQFPFKTDDYWRCAIRNIGTNIFHQVGTCKMGPKEDSDAVVDARLRVHGVTGVRVVDGSIMPSITSGNTNAPIIMIGQKGAEMIKEDWKTKHSEL